jgi:ribosomal protein S18 acetylase RimI-like enzyme
LRSGSETCALASVDGRPAAAGRCIFQDGELGEITSIATLPEFRRRGVGATLVSFLIRQLIDAGGSIAWLNAANEQAVSVYARLGFRSTGSLLNYELLADSDLGMS